MRDNQYTIVLHCQYMADKGELAKRITDSGKDISLSIVPELLVDDLKTEEGEEIYGRIHSKENHYPDWAKEWFRENKDNPNIIWIQEGYRHCCGTCFNKYEENKRRGKGAYPDPWHEHLCLGGKVQSLERQTIDISKGKIMITENLGIIPIGYCPPNHMYNKNTLKAVGKNGFKYFLTRNAFDYFLPEQVNLSAYEDNGLIIIPETKNTKTSPIVMAYYDHLKGLDNWRNFEKVLQLSIPLPELPVLLFQNNKPMIKAWMNEKLIIAYKKLRDWKKRFE